MPTQPLEVRTATEAEFAAIAELTATTYLTEGYGDTSYESTLRDVAGRARAATVLVAVIGGEVVGAVAVATKGGAYAEMAAPGEAVIRMLVVGPAARGSGAGTALVQGCLDAALADGCEVVRLSTQATMTAAHRIYERVGFIRTPERDWQLVRPVRRTRRPPGVSAGQRARTAAVLPALSAADGRAGNPDRLDRALRGARPDTGLTADLPRAVTAK